MNKFNHKVLAGLLTVLCALVFSFGAYADTVQTDVWSWSSTSKGKISIKSVETSLNCASAAGTCTATNLIPAGSIVLGVATRVTTLFAGCTSIDIGDGTDADKWGDDEAITAGSTTTVVHSTAGSPTAYNAATSVVLTAVGGATDFSAGVMKIVVFYMDTTAPQE